MRRACSISIWSACLLLLCWAAPSAVSSEPKQEAFTAKQVLDRMSKTYAGCKTYGDSGVVKTLFVQDTGTRTVEIPFKTAFVRPGQFRFEYKNGTDRHIIWSKGKDVQTWWDLQPGIQKPESLQLAVAGATGVSSGSAARIPAMLMPDSSRVGVAYTSVMPNGSKMARLTRSNAFALKGSTWTIQSRSGLIRSPILCDGSTNRRRLTPFAPR